MWVLSWQRQGQRLWGSSHHLRAVLAMQLDQSLCPLELAFGGLPHARMQMISCTEGSCHRKSRRRLQLNRASGEQQATCRDCNTSSHLIAAASLLLDVFGRKILASRLSRSSDSAREEGIFQSKSQSKRSQAHRSSSTADNTDVAIKL